MSHKVNCCRPDIKRCIEMIEEGIQAQCVGLEDIKNGHVREGREHLIFGIQKVEEGLHCLGRR